MARGPLTGAMINSRFVSRLSVNAANLQHRCATHSKQRSATQANGRPDLSADPFRESVNRGYRYYRCE